MITFAMLDTDGCAFTGGTAPDLPVGAVLLTSPWTVADLGSIMFVDDAWQSRPVLPPIRPSANGFLVSDLPTDIDLQIMDLGTGEITVLARAAGSSISHNLPDHSSSLVEMIAPKPWVNVSLRLVRGNGSAALAIAKLAQARSDKIAKINQAIGEVRLRYVTDIPGQQTIYTEKQAEAQRYLSAIPTPVMLADYPLLAAEVGVTAPTAWQLAQVWANKSVLFKQVAAITERLRMKASAAIAAALTEADVDDAVSAALTALYEGPL